MSGNLATISLHELCRDTDAVLDRVDRGERLTITHDGEPIAAIVPIDRSQRVLARWAADGTIATAPPSGYATAGQVARAARRVAPSAPSTAASDALGRMRADER